MEYYTQYVIESSPLIPDLASLTTKYLGWEIGETLHFTEPSCPERVLLGRVASYRFDKAKGVIERLLIRFKNTVKYNFAFDDLLWISPSDVVPNQL